MAATRFKQVLRALALIAAALALLGGNEALAHGIANKDATFVQATRGPAPLPFLYLDAKHMVAG